MAVRWWDPASQELKQTLKWRIPHPASSASFVPGETMLLAVGGGAGLVTVCVPGKKNTRVPLPSRRAAAEVVFSPEGRTLAILRERTLRLWDVKAKEVRASWKEDRTIHALVFSPDGGTLATGGHDGVVKFRDAATGKERAGFDWQLGPVGAVAFSPDGMLAAAGGEGRVVVWDVDQG
jgi:WD40 repeat protein